MATFLPHSALVGQQWEIAKGHLRAVVALQGSVSSDRRDPDEPLRFQIVEKVVEAFIADFELEGYHEGID